MKTSEPQMSPPKPLAKPRRFKRSQLALLFLLLLLGGGFVVWRVLMNTSQSPSSAAQQGPPPIPVETVTLERGEGVRTIQLLGQVEASKTSTIRSQTGGTVERVLVEVGDRVTPGMTLAILDDADQQLALASSRALLAQERSELAELEVGTRQEIIAQRRAELVSAQAREREAQDNLRRNSNLVTEGAISQRVLVEARATADAARAQRLQAEAALSEATAGPTREEIDAQRASVAAAQAAVNQAQLARERTVVKATAVGIVRSREVSTGDLVESNDPLLTLVNSNDLDVFLELPEQLSGSITPGMPVELAARAIPDWRGRANISGLVPVANAASRRQMVRVGLNNPPQDLLPKMAVVGELKLPIDAASFVVPRDALIRREQKWLVYTVTNGKAAEVEVKLVADMGEKMAIRAAAQANANGSDELQLGQPIVLRGGEALADGAVVQVAASNTKEPATSP